MYKNGHNNLFSTYLSIIYRRLLTVSNSPVLVKFIPYTPRLFGSFTRVVTIAFLFLFFLSFKVIQGTENYQPPKAKANRKQQLSLHSQHFQQRHTWARQKTGSSNAQQIILNLPRTQHCIRDLNLHGLWGRNTKPAQNLDFSVRHTCCVSIFGHRSSSPLKFSQQEFPKAAD